MVPGKRPVSSIFPCHEHVAEYTCNSGILGVFIGRMLDLFGVERYVGIVELG